MLRAQAPKRTLQNGWHRRLSKEEKAEAQTLTAPAGTVRPTTRGDCLDGGHNAQRPCPFVGCRHHLYLDVVDRNLKFTDPSRDLDEFPETCSLDVADRGGVTLEDLGALLNITRERTRQIEAIGLAAARENAGDKLEPLEDHTIP